jgi:hypothetical protein
MTFDESLAEALGSVNLTDTGEPVRLNKWLASELGLQGRPAEKRWRPARFTYVSDKANVRPRLNQFLATAPVVAAAVLGQNAEAGTREDLLDFAVAKVVGADRPAEVFVIVSEDRPRLLDIVGEANHPIVSKLQDLDADAQLHLMVSESKGPALVRGPALNLAPPPLIVDTQLERMIRLSVSASPAVMLVGPPGTGKSLLVDHVIERVQVEPDRFGIGHPPRGFRRVTAEEGWTFQDLVGGQTVVQGELMFRPGFLLQAIAANEWLVLDEANRADLDKIFGALLTWLAGQDVQIATATTTADAPAVELGWNRAAESSEGPSFNDLAGPAEAPNSLRYTANADWRLIGTYNALDAQRVFRVGQALGRRFLRVPVTPLDVGKFREVIAPWTIGMPDRVAEVLSGLYGVHLETEIPLGPALFLRAASYVVNGLRLDFGFDGGDDQSTEGLPAGAVEDLLVEAYLLGTGTYLAQQPSHELELLRSQTIERKLLSEAQWTFILDQLPSLI